MSDPGKVTFRRFGRSYHLSIESADDLAAVLELDEAHWVATGAPIDTMNCDATFLDLVDSDDNRRIMCYELKDAICWLFKNLRDLSGVAEGSASLPLDAINTDHDEGKRIHQSASKILDRLGCADADRITLEHIRRIKSTVESTAVSEAGVVLPEAAEDEEIKQFLTDIIAVVGGADHPSGRKGATRAQLDKFLADCRAYLEWQAAGGLAEGQTKSDIMPFGTDTGATFAVLASIRDKIDQYFAQCDAAALDPRVVDQLALSDDELKALDLADPAAISEMLKAAPLARPTAERVLTFDDQVNLYYAPQLARLGEKVIEPVLGRSVESLSESEWKTVKGRFAAYENWVNSKPGGAIETLGVDKLKTYLDEKYKTAVETLIARSTETAFVLDNVRLAEKLLLYQVWMVTLANNFVSFPHLYDAHSRAVFEMGTLIMDGRRFNFCVRVDDRAQHSKVAKESNMFVLYVEITPRQGGQKYEVAVPVTSGSKGNLSLGKRGVFQDIRGREFDATVVQIIENPISIGEALVSPFQRLAKSITGKIEAMTTVAEKKLDEAVKKVQVGKTAPPAAPAGVQGPAMGNILMGGGIAVAALGSSAAIMVNQLSRLGWYVFVVIAGAILAVMLPSLIMAFLKLRRRDLSSILEASGWAINSRMRLTVRQGWFFTQEPKYPKAASGIRRKRWWVTAIVVLLAGAIGLGWYLRSSRLKKADKPAASRPATAPAKK